MYEGEDLENADNAIVRRSTRQLYPRAALVEDGAQRESLEALKRSRTGHLADVTKKLKNFEESLDNDNLNDSYQSLLKSFDKYCDVHFKCTMLVQEIGDESYLVDLENQHKEMYAKMSAAHDKHEELKTVRLMSLSNPIPDERKCNKFDDAENIVNDENVLDNVSDVISSISSRSTHSTQSRREAVAAKKAALIAQTRLMEKALDLEAQQRMLQIQQRKLKMQAKIAAVEAEEKYYDGVVDDHLSKTLEKSARTLYSGLEPTISTGTMVQSSSAKQHKPGCSESKALPFADTEVQPNKWCVRCKSAINITFEYCNYCGCCQTRCSDEPVVNPCEELKAVIDRLDMPKVEIPTFDGDPIHYHEFMNAFQSTVEVKAVSKAVKLRQLIQYCTGKAREVIRPCLLMSAETGYEEAVKLLETRFGEQHKVAKAWIKVLVEGPVIKPQETSKLQEFTDKVRGCMLTLKALGKMNEVECQDRMIQILMKLPFFIQSRWRKEAYDEKQKTGAYPNFEEFAKFLERVTGEANDPIFGQGQLGQGKPDHAQSKHRERGAAFNIQDNPTDTVEGKFRVLECRRCSKEHKLSECPEFKSLTPEKRLEFVKAKRLCYNCIQYSNHGAARCRMQGLCHEVDCKGKHSGLLHNALMKSTPIKGDAEKTEGHENVEGNESHDFTGTVAAGADSSNSTSLPIVPILIQGKEGWIRTTALLDPGSTRTLCSKALVNKLKLIGETAQLDLKVVGALTKAAARKLQLQVKPVKGPKKLLLSEVYAIDEFPDIEATPIDTNRWPHLQDLQFLDHGRAELLIGNNVSQAFRCFEERCGADDEPIAVRTMFGWVLHGDCGSGQRSTCFFVQAETTALEKQVERFWKLDDTPAIDLPQYSQNDKAVLKLWDDSAVRIDNHYQLPIPFKKQPPQLPNNRPLAMKRLQCLQKKLERNPDLKEKYNEGIKELLDKGYSERVPDCGDSSMKWYIPHHNVVNPKKPDKFRIVFDCSAEYQTMSLNKAVFSGPDLTNKLVGVLMRFREKPVAVMGDIEGMFLQVKIPPEHRDALRFLYWENGNPALPVVEYRMTTHLFGGVWSPSAANYALKRTPVDYGMSVIGSRTPTDVNEAVSDSFYVDDCLRSCQDTHEAQRFIQNVSNVLAYGGFRITKWISNCPKVLEAVHEKDRAASVRNLDLDSLPVERALGVVWHTSSDTLGVQANPKEGPLTRRGVLKILSSIYDPLGLVSPFVLKAKLIFQHECRLNKGWDDPLEDISTKSWQKWLKDLPALGNLEFPRCLVPVEDNVGYELELHHFCDASEAAFGAVSYLRVIKATGSVHCSFIMSKSKLAPMKYLTIPRLELCAAVVATKLNTAIKYELRIDVKRTFYWTDSLIVLQYIKNKCKRFHTFVANRVSIIHENSFQGDWYHVGTNLNPADHASRGLDANGLLESKRWLQGPEYLWQSPSKWPAQPGGTTDLLEDDEEVKRSTTVLYTKTEEITQKPLDKLIEFYSCWYKLKKAVCWMRRFSQWMQNKESSRSKKLEASEMMDAERVLVKYVQRQSYPNDLVTLQGREMVNKKSELYSLVPVLDSDGIIRMLGRLRNAPIPDFTKQPAILPKAHHVTKLIIRHTHEFLSKHSGREYVLARLRERYWVPNVRATIRAVIANCYLCKRTRGKMMVQQMADLPPDRVTPFKPPFFYTGVDCFGPMMVKRGRVQEKRYGCLFTCMATRAIHLEVLSSLEADSFVNALVRFAARRTIPGKMISDNGTNFTGARNIIREEMSKWDKDKKFQNDILRRGIEWQLNPPAASHMGGAWERMIRTVRKILDTVLGSQVLDDERLTTVFCEIEAVVNKRPIVYVSDDDKVLTPQDLLQPHSEIMHWPASFRKEDQYGRRWRHVQYLVNQFWRKWTMEYLPTLQIRKKWLEPKMNLAVGDVVLVLNETLPRNQWPLAKVVEVNPGSDGLVRVVKVKTKEGVYVRPVHKLCLLESAASRVADESQK